MLASQKPSAGCTNVIIISFFYETIFWKYL